MEKSGGNSEGMKPLMLKAGIPLALSIVAGYICSKFISKNRTPYYESDGSTNTSANANATTQEIPPQPTSLCIQYEEQQPISSTTTYQFEDIEDNLLHLKNHLEALTTKELELEAKFIEYCELTELESNITELKNRAMLELHRVEFMEKEISLMEAENQRLGEWVIEYRRVLESVKGLKFENMLLKRKARKLCRKSIEKSRIIRRMEEKLRKVEGREEQEMAAHKREVEERDAFIQGLEDQINVLKCSMDRLCREKIELSDKFGHAQKSLIPKNDDEGSSKSKEDYANVLKELEEIRKDRAAEINELIHLRWSNACLRHELTRHQGQETVQEHQQEEGENNHLELELEFRSEGNDEDVDGIINNLDAHGHEHHHDDWDHDHAGRNGRICSRRKKFIKKLKKLVEGGGAGGKVEEKDKHNRFRGRSDAEEFAEGDQVVHARKSCSSANSVSF